MLRLSQRDSEMKKGHLLKGLSFSSFIQQISSSNTCSERGGNVLKIKVELSHGGGITETFHFLLFFPYND